MADNLGIVKINHNKKIGGPVDTIALLLLFSIIIYIVTQNILLDGVTLFASTLFVFGLFYYLFGKHLFVYEDKYIKTDFNFKSSKIPEKYKTEDKEKPDLFMELGWIIDQGIPLSIPYRILSQHGQVIGATGSGKTQTFLSLCNIQMANGGGICMVDGKENFKDFQWFINLAAIHGRLSEIYVISPDNILLSNLINPLLFGDPRSITNRISSLLSSDARAAFYKTQGSKFIQSVVGALQFLGYKFTMIDLMLISTNSAMLESVRQKLEQKDINSLTTIEFRSFLEQYRNSEGQLNIQTLQKNIAAITDKVYSFSSGNFGKITSQHNELELYDAICKSKLIYVMLPTMDKSSDAKEFGQLFVSYLRSCTASLNRHPHQQPKVPFMCIFDEAGAYANDNWDNLFQQCRSAGISLWIGAQSLANFDDVSPTFRRKVQTNTFVNIYCKMKDAQDRQEASDNLLEQYVTSSSVSNSKTDAKNMDFLRDNLDQKNTEGQNLVFNEKQEKLPICPPEVFNKLDAGQAIVQIEGKYVFAVQFSQMQPKEDVVWKTNCTIPVKLDKLK